MKRKVQEEYSLKTAVLFLLTAALTCSTAGRNADAVSVPDDNQQPRASGSSTNVAGTKREFATITINLGDYAKGDGTDETDAIQRAIDAFNVPRPNATNQYEFREQPGVLFIPAPKKFYGISRTINVMEKANLVIRCETPKDPFVDGHPAYFQWLGQDGGEMFFFNFCWGLRVENLSLSGNGKKVTGVQICDFSRPYPGQHPGTFKSSIFDHLTISRVGTGVKLGMDGSGADLAFNSFRDVHIIDFSEYGFVSATGNGADNTVYNLNVMPARDAKNGVRITSGQLVVMNSCLGGGPTKTTGAAVSVLCGGVHIIGCWSEWLGPFLHGDPAPAYPADLRTDSSTRYPVILEGVTHYPGAETQFWRTEGATNPVPVSIDWGQSKPLTLINCSFFGKVRMSEQAQTVIIDLGTVFSCTDAVKGGIPGVPAGFEGPGIEKYGRIIKLGTTSPENRNVLEPYVVDRRNTPGIKPPETGVWNKGDRILNIDPDPEAPAKSWAGWICIKDGEPGGWRPFGALGK